MKANNRFAAAEAKVFQDGSIRVKCAYQVAYAKDPFAGYPQLVFRCPICGEVHRHGYLPGDRIAHCDRDTWTTKTCRKDGIDILLCAGMTKGPRFGHFDLVPTDNFDQVGFLNKTQRERLVSKAMAGNIIENHDRYLKEREKARKMAEKTLGELVKVHRLLDALETDDPEKVKEAMDKNLNQQPAG